MLHIYRTLAEEKRLEELHFDKLYPEITMRVHLARDIIEYAGTKKLKNALKKHEGINARTLTAVLNAVIGNNTKFDSKEEWKNFYNPKHINPLIITDRRKILDLLDKMDEAQIRKILVSKPPELLLIEEEFDQKIKSTQINFLLKYVLGYTILANDEVSGYSVSDFIRGSGLKSCPYCNARSIKAHKTVNENTGQESEGLRSDLDHFFEKTAHPLLALSLYNLIPACLECNMRLKNQNPFDPDRYLHPYQQGFEKEDTESDSEQVVFKYHFTASEKSENKSDLINENDFVIAIITEPGISKIKYRRLLGDNSQGDSSKSGNINLFELTETYNEHDAKKEVLRIIRALDKNSNAYLSSLNWFDSASDDSDTSKTRYEQAIMTKFRKEEFYQDNFSKLCLDIFRHLLVLRRAPR